MASSFSIGTHYLHKSNPTPHFINKQTSPRFSLSLLPSHSHRYFGSSLCTLRASRFQLGNGLVVRAEDKSKTQSTNSELQGLTQESGSCDPLCSLDETSSQEFEANYQPKTDLLKALAVFAAAGTGALAINQSWVAANQDIAMALLFAIGYAGIIFEESLAFNKSGVGLLMAVSLWVIRSIGVSIVLICWGLISLLAATSAK